MKELSESNTTVIGLDAPGVPTNYIELAALLMPERELGLKEKLRAACDFFPMPLGLGWEKSPVGEEIVLQDTVPGLLLTDMASGGTRIVKAPWMHLLYKDILANHQRGSIMMQLKDIGFDPRFKWPHIVLLGGLFLQVTLAVYALITSRRRESFAIAAGIVVRFFEAIFIYTYPVHHPPRTVARNRFYMLHTGMTSTHLLVISQDSSGKQWRIGENRYVNLEDASVPLSRKSQGRHYKLERAFRGILASYRWSWKAFCVISPARGYMFPLVLLMGTGVMEFVSLWTHSVPRYSELTTMETGASVLDMMTAACQATGLVSVGLVESILPDPTGKHIDYHWIADVLEYGAINAGPHPTHPSTNAVLSMALRRRTVRVSILNYPLVFTILNSSSTPHSARNRRLASRNVLFLL